MSLEHSRTELKANNGPLLTIKADGQRTFRSSTFPGPFRQRSLGHFIRAPKPEMESACSCRGHIDIEFQYHASSWNPSINTIRTMSTARFNRITCPRIPRGLGSGYAEINCLDCLIISFFPYITPSPIHMAVLTFPPALNPRNRINLISSDGLYRI